LCCRQPEPRLPDPRGRGQLQEHQLVRRVRIARQRSRHSALVAQQRGLGGRVALLGIPAGAIAVDFDRIVFDMLTIKGIYGREMYETWYKMTVMLQSGLDIGPVITHRFHYTDYAKAFEIALSGESGKVVLDWTES